MTNHLRAVERPVPPVEPLRTERPGPRGAPRAAGASPSQAGTARSLASVARASEAAADHVRASARPWWFDVPKVALACVGVAVAPLTLAVRVAEAAVALALLGALAIGIGWHQGYIADKDVVAALKPVGQRILAMVQSAGSDGLR